MWFCWKFEILNNFDSFFVTFQLKFTFLLDDLQLKMGDNQGLRKKLNLERIMRSAQIGTKGIDSLLTWEGI